MENDPKWHYWNIFQKQIIKCLSKFTMNFQRDYFIDALYKKAKKKTLSC